ncbi:T3SS effector HopA1 family protein [Streptomyces sp. NPDC126499]|uniref:T3SS effector HopA1 family protein n=1 Tax=Streptomyces sp. NPDC126499 TaxID=3155314 RepID=UPI00332147FD
MRDLRGDIERVVLQDARGGSTPGEEELASRIYSALHSRRIPSNGRENAHREQYARMLTGIRGRLSDVTVPLANWALVGSAGESFVVRHRSGGEVAVPRSFVEIRDDGQVAVRAPAVAVSSDVRWLRWNPPVPDAEALRARIYLNLSPDRGVDTWCRTVRALHGAGVVFTSKIAGSRALLERADSGVLYLAPKELPSAVAVLGKAEIARDLDPQVPAFGGKFAPGIGVAIVPDQQPAHTSVGLHWALRFASAWLRQGSGGIDAVCSAMYRSWSDVLQHIAEDGKRDIGSADS